MPTGEVIQETVPPRECAALWAIAAMDYLDTAMWWARSKRRNRRSKVLHYSQRAHESMEKAKREIEAS